MSGAYWAIGSNYLLGHKMTERRDEMIAFIKACQHECGGFGGNFGHDPHVTTSLYALLVLSMFDATNEIDLDRLANYFKGLQNPDGSFMGDHSGEFDTRFSYCAVSALSLMNKLDMIIECRREISS